MSESTSPLRWHELLAHLHAAPAFRSSKADLPDGHTEAAIYSDEAMTLILGLVELARARHPETLDHPKVEMRLRTPSAERLA